MWNSVILIHIRDRINTRLWPLLQSHPLSTSTKFDRHPLTDIRTHRHRHINTLRVITILAPPLYRGVQLIAFQEISTAFVKTNVYSYITCQRDEKRQMQFIMRMDLIENFLLLSLQGICLHSDERRKALDDRLRPPVNSVGDRSMDVVGT